MQKPPFTILLIGLLCSLAINASSQRRNSAGTKFKTGNQRIRHIQGLKGIDVSVGLSQNGTVSRVGGMFYAQDNQSVRFAGLYEEATVFDSYIKRYVTDFTYAWSPLDMSGLIYFTVLGGLSASFNQSDASQELALRNSADIGLVLGGETEVFVFGLLSIFICADQRIDFLGNWGRWRNYNQIGLRLNIK